MTFSSVFVISRTIQDTTSTQFFFAYLGKCVSDAKHFVCNGKSMLPPVCVYVCVSDILTYRVHKYFDIDASHLYMI